MDLTRLDPLAVISKDFTVSPTPVFLLGSILGFLAFVLIFAALIKYLRKKF